MCLAHCITPALMIALRSNFSVDSHKIVDQPLHPFKTVVTDPSTPCLGRGGEGGKLHDYMYPWRARAKEREGQTIYSSLF